MKIQTLLTEELDNNSRTIVLVGETRNKVKGTLYVQVEAAEDLALTVSGRVSQTTDDVALMGVDMSTYTKIATITDDGIYWFLGEEFYSVTFTAVGSCRITLKVIE